MRHRTFLTMLATLLLAPTAALAGPPAESGNVVRILDDRGGFGVFPAFEQGLWVFSNVDRDMFCDWFATMGGPPPANLDGDVVMIVSSHDADVLLVEGGGPTTIHAWTGDDPGPDPCTGSEEEAMFIGDVAVRVNDNDIGDTGARANTWGDRGHGVVTDVDGNEYSLSWRFRAQTSPDGSQFRVLVDEFVFAARG